MYSGCDEQRQYRAGHEGKVQCWSEGELSTNLSDACMYVYGVLVSNSRCNDPPSTHSWLVRTSDYSTYSWLTNILLVHMYIRTYGTTYTSPSP